MQKLVVYFVTDEERILYLEHIRCIEYESASAFLADFEKCLFDARNEDSEKRFEQWLKEEPVHSFPPDKAEMAALTEWTKRRPKRNYVYECDEFSLAGEIFAKYDFCEGYRPEVYELNEWFDKFKGRPV